MAARVYRRCGCRDPQTGKQLGKACPRLKDAKHGSWGFVCEAPGSDGLRLQIRRSGFPTRKAAEDAMAEVNVEVRSGRRVQRGAGRLTVGEYLRQWIRDKERDGTRPKTLEGYAYHVDRILIPALGRIRLAELHPGHVEECIRRWRERAEEQYGRPVKATTQERIRATLRSALTDARRQGLVSYNAAADARLPKVTRSRVKPWEPEQLGQFLDFTNGTRLHPLWTLAALTGLRRGELLGLRWSDYDAARRRLVVRQQLVTVGGRLVFSPPKSAAGEDRIVDLDETTAGALALHRLAQDGEREQWADAYEDHDLIFCQENGRPYDPTRITAEFRQAVEESGLPRIRLHDLRHGAASLHLAAGTSIEIVSKLLGHSTTAITADTYSHLLEGTRRAAVEAAAKLVPRSENHDRDHHVTTDSTKGA